MIVKESNLMRPTVCDCLTTEQRGRGYHIDLRCDQSAVLMFGIKDVEYYTPLVNFDTIRKDADLHWSILQRYKSP